MQQHGGDHASLFVEMPTPSTTGLEAHSLSFPHIPETWNVKTDLTSPTTGVASVKGNQAGISSDENMNHSDCSEACRNKADTEAARPW